MVHNEASGVAQAMRTEARAITISGDHQDVGSRASLYHLPFGTPTAVDKLHTLATEPRSGSLQQRRSLFLYSLFSGAARVSVVPMDSSSQQASRCSFHSLANIGRRHVKKRNFCPR
jgi:hypothetical protein